ncbi:hypothetical protein NSU18_29750 [Paenibacillus sp. FSL H8-0048]|uniref:YncE family protein n=1 Tax=Paenibacillus sp. FSL H8-0048 TaxID=2954508 RepID=UPI0030F7CFCE
MNRNLTAEHNRNTSSGLSYVYASYVVNNKAGYVAVIDPTTDEIIKRISTGKSPSAMCLSPSGDKLYVADDITNAVLVYSTDTFKFLAAFPVGSKPVAVFVESGGKIGYVANYGENETGSMTVFDAITLQSQGTGILLDKPFAFASNKNTPYVYMACQSRPPFGDFVYILNVDDDGMESLEYSSIEPIFDQNHNPLAVRLNGHILAVLANIGFLYDYTHVHHKATSLLDNTVSGVYLDNGLLFCTMQEQRDFLKVIKNLDFDADGNVIYDNSQEIPSYKGQDKIRTSLTQKYIGVTIQPTDSPTGGLQIIDVASLNSRFVDLDSVGDLAFYSDSKAYVGEGNMVHSIDLATGTPLTAIDVAGNNNTVKNIISGYSNQSS